MARRGYEKAHFTLKLGEFCRDDPITYNDLCWNDQRIPLILYPNFENKSRSSKQQGEYPPCNGRWCLRQ